MDGTRGRASLEPSRDAAPGRPDVARPRLHACGVRSALHRVQRPTHRQGAVGTRRVQPVQIERPSDRRAIACNLPELRRLGASIQDHAQPHQVHRDRLQRPNLPRSRVLHVVGVHNQAAKRQPVARTPRQRRDLTVQMPARRRRADIGMGRTHSPASASPQPGHLDASDDLVGRRAEVHWAGPTTSQSGCTSIAPSLRPLLGWRAKEEGEEETSAACSQPSLASGRWTAAARLGRCRRRSAQPPTEASLTHGRPPPSATAGKPNALGTATAISRPPSRPVRPPGRSKE